MPNQNKCIFCGSLNLEEQSQERLKCNDCGQRFRPRKTTPIDVNSEKSNINEPQQYVQETSDIDGSTKFECLTDRIKTLDDLIADRKIDMNKMVCISFECTNWEGFYRNKDRTCHTVVPLYRIKAKFEPILKTELDFALERFIERLNNPAPVSRYSQPETQKKYMLEMSLYDHHFGKLAWEPETGNSFDLKIAKELYVNAVIDLLQKTSTYPLEEIILVVGQDFLNINNEEGTTEKGTYQDGDSRLGKVLDIAIDSIHESVAEMLNYARVKILWVPGNHDKLTSYTICKILQAYYKNDERVTVDVGEKTRKYVEFGNVLLGFTHGNEEKKSSLPLIMAGEASEAWGRTKYREIQCGHNHTKKQTNYNSGDSIVGIIVRTLGSLTATDAWHYKKGYVNNIRQAECFLWDREQGLVGEFFHNL